MLFGDVAIPNDVLVVFTALLGALVTALTVLWREMLRWRNDQIADLRQQRDDLLRVLYRHGLEDNLPASVPHSAVPPSRAPDTPPGGRDGPT